MYALLSLNVTLTLTFDLESTKFNRGHLLVMTNNQNQVKRSLGYEFSSYWSDKVCLRMDRTTDLLMD